MADVFISYHAESAGDMARQIAFALESAGISCWYATRDLLPGSLAGAIVQAIEDCRVFLLILDKQSCHSQHVASEMAIAFRRVMNYENITILPLRMGNCPLSDDMRYYLSRFQFFDGCPPKEELVKQISKILNPKRPVSIKAAAKTSLENGMQS